MKRSQVVETLLEAYYFQEGQRANSRVTEKAEKIISNFKKEECKLLEKDSI